MPGWLQALILGIVQGLTEFIPVSSSGHLVLIPFLFGWEKNSLAFDVMLHLGTTVALLWYFRGELIAIVNGILGRDTSEQGRTYRRVGWLIIPASIPAAILGITLEDQIESVFAAPIAAPIFLLGTALLLFGLEYVRTRRVHVAKNAAKQGTAVTTAPTEDDTTLPLGIDLDDPSGSDLRQITLRHAVVAGLFQSLALLPGISRSGSTIAGGVFSGLSREAATRFSFLMVIPVLLGATLLSIDDLASGGESTVELAVGTIAAGISGYAAIRYLVSYVSRASLRVFAWYCVAASAVGFTATALHG